MKNLLILCVFFCAIFVYSQENKVISEDFESYEIGEFPKGSWNDIIDVSIPKTAPSPSATIIETIDHTGNKIKAIQFQRGVTTSCGFYKKIDNREGEIYKIEATMKVNHWSNSSRPFFTDWAVAFGMFSIYDGYDFNAGPQLTFVTQPVSDNLVVYALRSDVKAYNEYFNIEFEDKVKLDTWYNITLELNNKTGLVKTKLIEAKSGNAIHKKETQIPNWDSEKSGNYNFVGAWDGEYNTDATLGNQVTISKFSLTVE